MTVGGVCLVAQTWLAARWALSPDRPLWALAVGACAAVGIFASLAALLPRQPAWWVFLVWTCVTVGYGLVLHVQAGGRLPTDVIVVVTYVLVGVVYVSARTG